MCVCVCVCVCVCERERERKCICVCKVMRVERVGVQMLEFDGQNSCDHFEPVVHPATKTITLPSSSSRQLTVYADTSAEWRYGTFEHRPETEEAHSGKPRRHRLFTEALRTEYSGGIGKRKKIFFFDFSKKAENHFKKSGK